MDIFGEAFGDAIIYDTPVGDFRLSTYGLVLSSFSIDDTYELGMSNSINEEYLSYHSVPILLSTKYDSSSKLKGSLTIVKNECDVQTPEERNYFFSTAEARTVLRALTGWHGYKRMFFYDENGNMENKFYRIHVNNASQIVMGGKTVGLTFEFECDSPYIWESVVNEIVFEDPSGGYSDIYIDADSNEYILPRVGIQIENPIYEQVDVTITSTNEIRTTTFYGMLGNISLDGVANKITSVLDPAVANHFNRKFPRLVPGSNRITVNMPMTIAFYYDIPRKVGWN